MTHRKAMPEEIVEADPWRRAIFEYYLRRGDSRPLDALKASGVTPPPLARHWLEKLENGKLKRKSGRPPSIRYSDATIVELVWKQQLQGGHPFTNTYGADYNECFLRVAEHLHVDVRTVRRAWKRVPDAQRTMIKNRLREALRKARVLHPRHR